MLNPGDLVKVVLAPNMDRVPNIAKRIADLEGQILEVEYISGWAKGFVQLKGHRYLVPVKCLELVFER